MIFVREGHIESAIRFFKKQTDRSAIFREKKLKEEYPKRSERKKAKARVARRRKFLHQKRRNFYADKDDEKKGEVCL